MEYVVRVTGASGPHNHIVALPETLGLARHALRFDRLGAERLAAALCASGWVAYVEPFRL